MLSIWGSQEKSRESITRSPACSPAGRLTSHKWRASLHSRSDPLSQTHSLFEFYLFLFKFYSSPPPFHPGETHCETTQRWAGDWETISLPCYLLNTPDIPVFAEGLRSGFSGIHAGVTLEEKLREKFRF